MELYTSELRSKVQPPGRAADWSCRVELSEDHTLASKLVQVGGGGGRVAVVGEISPAQLLAGSQRDRRVREKSSMLHTHVVCEENDDVWFFGACVDSSGGVHRDPAEPEVQKTSSRLHRRYHSFSTHTTNSLRMRCHAG